MIYPENRLKSALYEFWLFGVKQAWACLFGGIMLGLIIASKYFWQADWSLARYDFLFISALLVQILFLTFRLEHWEEAKVIFIFHVVGTVMEIFKTHVDSWIYPEANIFRIGGVPLFSGFMYSCVGSYIVRATNIFQLRYDRYPPMWTTIALCIAIYVNFFSHHYMWDMRWLLFAVTILLFFKTQVYFTPAHTPRHMPLLLGFFLVAFFIWIAENIGTFTATWAYPDQQIWEFVRLGKLGSWYLLMIISFVLVTFVHRPEAPSD